MSNDNPRPDPGLQAIARAARFVGYVRGAHMALRIVVRHLGWSSPVAQEVYAAVIAATEEIAAHPVNVDG